LIPRGAAKFKRRKMSAYTIENRIRVYDEDSGEYIEICPDADGLMCVDIRQCDRDGKILARITANREMMSSVREALDRFLK